jgi:hypothetical protein
MTRGAKRCKIDDYTAPGYYRDSFLSDPLILKEKSLLR